MIKSHQNFPWGLAELSEPLSNVLDNPDIEPGVILTKRASRSVDVTGWIIIKVAIPSNTQTHEHHVKRGAAIAVSSWRY